MFRRIDHLEIVTKDFGKSLQFYEKILGFSLVSRIKVEEKPLKEIAYLKLNNTTIELIAADLKPGYRMMALEVEDMSKAVEYLKSKGVEISSGPIALGESKRAEIKGPDGISIELREWYNDRKN